MSRFVGFDVRWLRSGCLMFRGVMIITIACGASIHPFQILQCCLSLPFRPLLPLLLHCPWSVSG